MEKVEVHHGTAEEIQALRQKKRQDLKDEEVQALMSALSVRERLERKFQTDEIKVELEDDLGKFMLKFRKLTPLEHDQIARIQGQLRIAGDDKKKTELMEQIYRILGSASLDGLDADYWKEGSGYSPDLLVLAVLKVMAASAFPDEKYLKDLVSFRPL